MARRRLAFDLKPNPLGKPQAGRTGVVYLAGEDSFYTFVFDGPLLAYLAYTDSEDWSGAILGAVELAIAQVTGDKYGEPETVEACWPVTAYARPGYGPLAYDLTALGLKKHGKPCEAVHPSENLSPHSTRYWSRRDYRPLEPLKPDNFKAKYGMAPRALGTQGRKALREAASSVGTRVAQARILEAGEVLSRQFIGYFAKPNKMSDMLAKTGY